ncbi:MAG: hypothetical protein C0501_27920 [Isosphaera sp.]|nr:hypothetical protein [Isosphaera sp.]
MPSLKIDCPACDASVRVPDGAAAVACPDCGHKIRVAAKKPAAADPPAKKPAKAAAVADVTDEAPRKKKKKKAAAAAGMDPFTKRLVGYGIAGVIAIGGAVGSWLGFGGKGKDRGPDVAAVNNDDPGDDEPKAAPKGKGKDKGKGRPAPEPEPKKEEPKKEEPPKGPEPKEEPKVEVPPPPKKAPEEISIKLPDPPKIRISGSAVPKGGPAVARPPATPPLAPDEDPFLRAKAFRPDGPLPTLPKLPLAKDRPLLTLDSGGHSAFVKNAFITPKGDRVVTVGEDKAVRIWDIKTGDPVHIVRLPAGPGDEGSLLAAALSPNGKRLAVAGIPLKGTKGGQVPIFLINVDTGTLGKTIASAREAVNCLDFSANGNQLAVGCLDGTVQLFDVNTSNPAGEVQAHLGGVREVRFNPNPKARILATIGSDRTVRIFDLANPGRNARVTNPEFGPTCLDWTSDGRTLGVGGTSGAVALFGLDGKLIRTLPPHKHGDEVVQVIRMQFLAGDADIACGGVGAGGWAGVRTAADGSVKVAFTSHSNTVMALNVSADGARVVSSGGNQNETYVWDAADGKVVSRLCGQGNGMWGVGWARDGKSLAFGTDNTIEANGTRKLEYTFRLDDFGAGGAPEASKYEQGLRDDGTYRCELGPDVLLMGPTAAGGPRVVAALPGKEKIFSATLLPGRRMAVVGGAFSQVLVDPHDGRLIRTFTGHTGHILSVAPSPDGKYFVTGSSDQTIRVWLPDQDEPVLSLFVAGRDWIAWTPQGFYACSGHGERLIAWQVNAGAAKLPLVHPAARFRPSMYQPAIVKYLIPAGNLPLALAMAEKYDKALVRTTSVADIVPPEVVLESPAPPAAGKDGKEEPPLTTDAGTVVVRASAKGSVKQPVTAMRLLVDGRPFQGSAGVKRFDPAKPDAAATWEVPVAPGPHSFAVIAETGVCKGMSKVAVVTRSGETPKPNLYVLAMGVSKYPAPVTPLTYAASDAHLLAKAFNEKSKGVFAAIEVKVLTDGQATKKGIREGLDWMKSKMTPQDVGVVAFSGHGLRDPLGRFYLAPSDISADDAAGTCFPGDEFRARLEDMPGRLVAILDACHSGGVVEKDRPPARTDGLVRDLVSEDAGVVVMCASLGREYAIESPATKAGFFTLGLVEGMSGHGDVDGDGVVYIHELDLYATARVVQLSGGLQTPTTGRPPGVRPFPIAKP